MSGCQCHGAAAVFGRGMAERDLKRYRKRGPNKSTGMLVSQLRAAGVGDASLLDIGSGVGAVANALLAAGAKRALLVDASPAYLEAARDEATRLGQVDKMEFLCGDFVELASGIEPADVVTLDRVICCYDQVEALVATSATRAVNLYGLVYPRQVWWNRLAAAAANLALTLTRQPFRVFIHPPALVHELAGEAGLKTVSRQRTLFWEVVVYGR